jgi:hypothetical protein
METRETRFSLHLGRLAASPLPSWADCVMRASRGAPASRARGTPATRTDSIRECVAPLLDMPSSPSPASLAG